MKLSLKVKRVSLGLCLLAHTNYSFARDQINVQRIIQGTNGLRLTIPQDGTFCDPNIIKNNLIKLDQSNVFTFTTLSETIPAYGHCYGACMDDLEDALVKYCAKAEILSEMVELL